MRCSCCDRNLNDYESTLRHAETHEFLDTCMKCLDGTNIPTIGREDLSKFEYSIEEDENGCEDQCVDE
jgi:hypothetical protein